uniref:Uncharacterized protein n=1 Tax=Anoplophora glabripennis TaxID=217634 RepID=V5G3A8_ANOGL
MPMTTRKKSETIDSNMANNQAEGSANTITMTEDQCDALIQSIRAVTVPQAALIGNFSKCSSRFDGSKDSNISVFIDAVKIFKDCSNVSDENALRGLPMLLDGFAATLWQRVKSGIDTWAKAIDLLRSTYGPKKACVSRLS